MNPDIHRLLDEAFTGVEMTPDAQDLKEEIRANLVARVDELEASGTNPTDAARRAIAELGDVREMLDDSGPAAPGSSAATGPAPATGDDHHALMARNRVRPRPAFVVRTTLLSIVAAASLVVFVVAKFGIVSLGMAALAATGLIFAVAVGIITSDALSQETTSNHPMPAPRAVGFGLATGGLFAALGLGATFVLHTDTVWLIVVAGVLFVASVGLFAWLGATQTNRHKAWTREYARNMPADRFTTDPNAAARFGIYTAVIWLVALVALGVIGFTVGWWWSLLALVGGFAAMMILLARMLFGHKD